MKSSHEIAEIRPRFNFIEKIEIKDDGLLEDCELEFSPHLNVLIGGRSSGKSLMMSVLGDKIDSVRIDRTKYNIGYDDIKVKSSFDMLYKDSASIGKDEIIYIRQGEIVRYFEKHKLQDLAKEAGKASEYDEARRKFTEHKQSLEETLEAFLVSYNECLGLTSESHVLHNTTIENILNKNFVFTWNKEKVTKKVDKTDEIQEANELLETTLDSAKKLKLKQILEFNEAEIETIDTYISLIEAKKGFLQRKKLRHETKLTFLERVDSLIDTKNEALNEGARSKSESKKTRETLINSIGEKFESLVSLRKKCKSFASFQYEMQQSIEINEKVALILEVEEENSLSELFLDGINGGDISRLC